MSDEEKNKQAEPAASREAYPVMDLGNGIVGWESQEDPLNPRNYPPSRKWFQLATVSIITFISPFASSVFAPGVSLAEQEFGETSSIRGSFAVTAYLFGYFSGPLVLSPLSEICGRRITLNAATTIFVLFQIGCALAPNLSALIVFRFLTGFGGSGCLTIGGGVVADLFEAEQRGLALSVFSFGPLFAPVIGPICGGFIAQRAGWRWSFWVLVIVGGTLTGIVMVTNRETNPTVLIRRKTVALRKELSRPELCSSYEKEGEARGLATLLMKTSTRVIKLLVTSPIVLMMALYIASVYGCLYLLFTTITSVFQDQYGWSVETSGLAYIGLGLGFFAGQVVFALTSDRTLVRLKRRNNNIVEPEMRLPLCLPFALFVPISFFWYGWSVQEKTHWIVPIIGLFPFAFGNIGIFGTLQAYIVDSYPRYAASGIGAMTVTRSLFGALLPLAGPPMYEKLGYGWGNSLLGFVTLAMISLPILFSRFGASLRQRFPVDLE
ncbi:MFS multidrug transporter [Aspergillus nomiae NRRL 13137]|uniref:MFS multidrug transporter n=1 Tax=Aspergillus nomiae NRRL (strain ATCC 15546 / NRRL 13137 / CBS 260.88 / M93) TaxID=1509407 RepID=A0A0L1IWE8_ASPN3|nr:MFS multidrug transporter [Aspergillus nomiae NRRL 13137]KNG83886.1 MFS multidrug transporter [Aspergillus nomiae NRRL 13137]